MLRRLSLRVAACASAAALDAAEPKLPNTPRPGKAYQRCRIDKVKPANIATLGRDLRRYGVTP